MDGGKLEAVKRRTKEDNLSEGLGQKRGKKTLANTDGKELLSREEFEEINDENARWSYQLKEKNSEHSKRQNRHPLESTSINARQRWNVNPREWEFRLTSLMNHVPTPQMKLNQCKLITN